MATDMSHLALASSMVAVVAHVLCIVLSILMRTGEDLLAGSLRVQEL